MKKFPKIFIISILILILILGNNIVISHQLDFLSKKHINNPPRIIKSLTYYDKYNDILYITAMDPDNDKICVGVDWDKDQKIDEWSDYRRIQTRWEFKCFGKTGLVYIVAEDNHGLRSEWHDTSHKILNSILNNYLFIYISNKK